MWNAGAKCVVFLCPETSVNVQYVILQSIAALDTLYSWVWWIVSCVGFLL